MTVKCDGTTIYTRTKRGYATDLIPTASNYTTQYQTAFGSAEGTRFLTVMTDNADTEAAGYGEYTITHGTDGTKTVTLSWEANCSYTSSLGTVTGSGAVVLPAIDRAAPTVTLQSGNITASGFSLTVLSSAIADRWEYKLNSGSWVQFSTNEASSASVTLNSLSTNTTYSVQVRARKKSNHVYGTSSSTSITTLGGSVLTSVSAIQANSSSAKVQFNMTVYDSTYTHTLVISKSGTDLLTFTGITGLNGANTRSILLTTAQRNVLMAAMPTEAQATVTYTLHTYNSSNEEIGSGSTATGTVVITAASAPTFTSFTVRDYSSSTVPVTGSSAVLIQNQSSARISCSAATASSGTSISKYRATIGEKTVESSTTTINFGTISDSGEVSIIVEAIDRRGFSTAVTQTLNIIPYQSVSIESWSVSRQNNVEATINMSFAGQFSSIMVNGVEKNSLVSVSYRYKVSTSATYGSSTALTGTTVTGKIILLDLKQFFPSIPHRPLYDRHNRLILSNELRTIADMIVATSEKGYGMPLGVEPSQIEMVSVLSALDNYIKCQLSIKHMGHYMDDYYLMVPPDRDARAILSAVTEKAASIGVKISSRKTKIIPVGEQFRYCKVKYTLTETGAVKRNGSRDTMKRYRHKLKLFPKLLSERKMTYADLWGSVNSVMAYFKRYDDHNRLLKARRIFYSSFGFSAENYNEFARRT